MITAKQLRKNTNKQTEQIQEFELNHFATEERINFLLRIIESYVINASNEGEYRTTFSIKVLDEFAGDDSALQAMMDDIVCILRILGYTVWHDGAFIRNLDISWGKNND